VQLNIKFLIIHTINNINDYTKLDESKIVNIKLIQKEILLEDCPDVYLRNNEKIQKQFLEYLKECDIDTTQKSNIIFTDMS
jgi:hypothetical protein